MCFNNECFTAKIMKNQPFPFQLIKSSQSGIYQTWALMLTVVSGKRNNRSQDGSRDLFKNSWLHK